MGLWKHLLTEIENMPVIDTHEHLVPESERISGEVDFFTVMMAHYASSDIVSAGMKQQEMDFLRDIKNDFEKKVSMFLPVWNKTKNTSYCRALLIASKDIYGYGEFNEETLPLINAEMKKKNRAGLYKEILENKSKIKYCVWDQWYHDVPPFDTFFKPALRLDEIIYIKSKDDIDALNKKFDRNITTPEALQEIMEIVITNNKPGGLIALKTALAYDRTLLYERVTPNEAAVALDRILQNRFTDKETKRLQDYMMYCVAQKAYWHGLPLQIHTGLQEGNGNYIMTSNPALLTELIMNNPDTRFDLFHGGYPFGGELAAVAKYFPNVYLDMCWTHAISPSYSVRYLNEWLDTVPANKILGFGGDYIFAEGTYGHLKIAQENIAKALGARIEDGSCCEKEALKYAKMILHDNPSELFAL